MNRFSDLSLEKSLQYFIERGFPNFVEDTGLDYTEFIKFVKVFFEYLEKTSIKQISHMRDFKDIDNTVEEFIDFFYNEYLYGFPKNIEGISDANIIRISRDILNQKGSIASYIFLLKMMFNKKVKVTLPRYNTFTLGESRYEKKVSLLTTTNNSSYDLNSHKIVGITSGASAIIEYNETFVQQNDIEVMELFLHDVKGTFQTGEEIQFFGIYEDELENETIYPRIVGINILHPGSGYIVGDSFAIYQDATFSFKDLAIFVDDFEGVPFYQIPVMDLFDYSIFGQDGDEIIVSSGVVKKIKNNYISSINVLNGGSGYEGKYYLDSDGDFTEQNIFDSVYISDTSSAGKNATAHIAVTYENGEIGSILVTNGGENYYNPSATALSENGSSASLQPIVSNGGVYDYRLFSFPAVPMETEYNDNYIVDFSLHGNSDAFAEVVFGALAEYEGFWYEWAGHVSHNTHVFDAHYYQYYSYEVHIDEIFKEWREEFMNFVHPIGFKLFANHFTDIEININEELTFEMEYE